LIVFLILLHLILILYYLHHLLKEVLLSKMQPSHLEPSEASSGYEGGVDASTGGARQQDTSVKQKKTNTFAMGLENESREAARGGDVDQSHSDHVHFTTIAAGRTED
jgi:hypothetical protein